jgi:hypothetical protein
MKVKCINCEKYKLFPNQTWEPLGYCDDLQICPQFEQWMSNGYNWRTNYRYSKALRYCKGFSNKTNQQP